jgi:serine/threonine-protein kinase HipA
LEEASREFEKDENLLDGKWLKQLLAPGSSLGGARPKATVKDVDGSLWIAKFPSKHDEYDSGAWEKTVHDLAKLCRLNVPESRLMKFSKFGSTFLAKRFDREGVKRIHFMSAMTALGKKDGANATDGTGYLDIAAFIGAYGAAPQEDLKELWRRIVFNMAVSNTDDHLRNHGFILTSKGWRLSALYDVNPIPDGASLSLNVSEEDNSLSVDLAVEVAEQFMIPQKEAVALADEIVSTVRDNWRKIAEKNGLSKSSIEYMKSAFALCY